MRRILVPIKRVIDYNVRVRVKPDGSGVVTDGVKLSINPFDEIAVEEALRIRERGEADEIVVATIGPPGCEQQLRTALALGADRAVHVVEDNAADALCVAELLLALTRRLDPFLVILGKQSIDEDNGQTGQMLAALWERPQATYVSELEITPDKARATREIDSGLETLEIDLPAVVTTDLRLNEPRFVRLPEILKAKKKEIERLSAAELDVEVQQRLRSIGVEPPPERAPGIALGSVDALIDELTNRGLL
jgi:electron transfer flavoprotein beta subunit